jgi:hypothetical protein
MRQVQRAVQRGAQSQLSEYELGISANAAGEASSRLAGDDRSEEKAPECNDEPRATAQGGSEKEAAAVADNSRTKNTNSFTATSAAAPSQPSGLSQKYLQFVEKFNVNVSSQATRNRDPLLRRTCACRDSSRCRLITKEWLRLGDEYKHMVDYVVPPRKSKDDTTMACFRNGYRDGCLRHLYGENADVPDTKSNLTVVSIAFHHFDPCLREELRLSKNKKHLDKFRCSLELGEEAGLTEEDLCGFDDSEGNTTYYAFPTITDYTTIEHELNVAKLKRFYEHKIDATVMEKPKEAHLQGIAAHPEIYESRMTFLGEQLAQWQQTHEKLTAEKEAEKVKYEAKIKEMQQELDQYKKCENAEEILLASSALHNLSSNAPEIYEEHKGKNPRSKRTRKKTNEVKNSQKQEKKNQVDRRTRKRKK